MKWDELRAELNKCFDRFHTGLRKNEYDYFVYGVSIRSNSCCSHMDNTIQTLTDKTP